MAASILLPLRILGTSAADIDHDMCRNLDRPDIFPVDIRELPLVVAIIFCKLLFGCLCIPLFMPLLQLAAADRKTCADLALLWLHVHHLRHVFLADRFYWMRSLLLLRESDIWLHQDRLIEQGMSEWCSCSMRLFSPAASQIRKRC